MMPSPVISLPLFDGPLDLLLALVRKNEIDIADIPIAEITRQYLDYLHQAEQFNMDLGSEFVYIAALLIHIKSRCLLAADPEIAGGGDDPRQELVRLLLDPGQVRQGAEFLRQKLEVSSVSWSNSALDSFCETPAEDGADSGGALNLFQVLRLARQALDTARTYEIVTPSDSVTVEEMIRWLEERTATAGSRLDAGELLAEQPDPPHRAALFLGLLEMAQAARIRLEQQQCFGPISVAGVPRITQTSHSSEY